MRLPGVSLGPIAITGSVKQVTGDPPGIQPITVDSAYYTGTAIASGNSDGGDAVTITGTGFIYAVVSVTFGGQAATSVVLVDAETITCVTPAHAAGAVDVVVTLTSGAVGTGSGIYTYADLALNSITPSSGSTAGGALVALAGAGFQGDMTVTIGGTSCTSVVYTPTTITCRTPAKTAAAYDVVVDGTATLTGGYTYAAAAALDYPVYGGGLPGERLHLQETWANVTAIGDIFSQVRSDGGAAWRALGGTTITSHAAVASATPDPWVGSKYLSVNYAEDGPIEAHGTGAHAAGYHWAYAYPDGDLQGDDNSDPNNDNIYETSTKNYRGFWSGSNPWSNLPNRQSVVWEWALRCTGSNWYEGKTMDINSGVNMSNPPVCVGRILHDAVWNSEMGWGTTSTAKKACSLTSTYYTGGTTLTATGVALKAPPTYNYPCPGVSVIGGSYLGSLLGSSARYKQNMNWGSSAGEFSWGSDWLAKYPNTTNADAKGTATAMWNAGWLRFTLRLTQEGVGDSYGNGRIEMWVTNADGTVVKILEYLGDVGQRDAGNVYVTPDPSFNLLLNNSYSNFDFMNLCSRGYTGGAQHDIGFFRVWSHDKLSI